MAIPAELKPLPGPYEILESLNREEVYLRVLDWEWGWVDIRPRWPGAPEVKRVAALRIHVGPGGKPFFPWYFDLTSRRLTAGVAPVLAEVRARKAYLRIKKYGERPKAWFEWSVEEVLPPKVSPGVPVRLEALEGGEGVRR